MFIHSYNIEVQIASIAQMHECICIYLIVKYLKKVFCFNLLLNVIYSYDSNAAFCIFEQAFKRTVIQEAAFLVTCQSKIFCESQ